ncbi:MAG: replicative DNA helicase, partial [Anaerolineae bacterium]|nr:replicative DNA helicase [Anaerolineae bacterium]
ALRRRLIGAASDIAGLAHDETRDINQVIDAAESSLFTVTERRLRRELVPMGLAISQYFDRIEQLRLTKEGAFGVPTGFTDLDKLLGGLQKNDLLIIAGRPGMGKTSWLLTLALNAARTGKARVAIFSMEMSNEQLVQRMLSSETGISSQALRLGRVDEIQWQRFIEGVGTLSSLRIYLDDSPALSPSQLRTKCRRLYREHGLDLVIVDYLQLMNAGVGMSRDTNRVQEITYISRALKELARELGVPVLAAAQLSRAVEQRQDKRPQLSDLRESGCLSGDTLVTLADSGRRVPIRDLVGRSGFAVWALNEATMKLQRATVSRAFCTGVKRVFRLTSRLGRTIRATGNHKFLTLHGWKRLDELTAGDRIALPRTLPGSCDVLYARDHSPFSGLPSQLARGLEPLATPRAEAGSARAASVIPAPAAELLLVRDDGESDIYWDQVESIVPDGEAEVFDLTVPELHNFIANHIVVHNSIEQDADVVMFIYRDEVYNEDTDRPRQADVIVAKHRNGPTDTITLLFRKEQTKFENLRMTGVDLTNI